MEGGIYKKYQDGVQILVPILDGASHLHIFQVFIDPKSENHNIRSPISEVIFDSSKLCPLVFYLAPSQLSWPARYTYLLFIEPLHIGQDSQTL